MTLPSLYDYSFPDWEQVWSEWAMGEEVGEVGPHRERLAKSSTQAGPDHCALSHEKILQQKLVCSLTACPGTKYLVACYFDLSDRAA